jgi:predicted ribosome quality control (RQC) complex YloA/Tae2 family protein
MSWLTSIQLPAKKEQWYLMSTIGKNDELVDEVSGVATYDSDDNNYDDDDDDDDDFEEDNGVDERSITTSSDEPIDNPSRLSLLHEALRTSVQTALDNLSRKTTSLQRELDKARSLEETMKRANLIVANLYRLPKGTTSIEVDDWENGATIELVLNTKEYDSAQEESDALFALARKMKRGSKVVEELMKSSLDAEQELNEVILELESMAILNEENLDEGKLILIQQRLELSSTKTGFQSPNISEMSSEASLQGRKKPNNKKGTRKAVSKGPNPRVLTSPSGHRVLVGRNRRDNEAICFQLSKPTDIWMHSRGCPGAHVLLCVRRGSPKVTDEDLQFAANLAAFYSDARTERQAAITTAEPKHITKPRGAPLGAVSLRQEGKSILGRPEDVSDDLKEAREKSGTAWDETGYRKLGTRVKNTKRTAAVDQATRDKARLDAKDKNNRRKTTRDDQDFY